MAYQISPRTTIASGNANTQRALAIPFYVVRLQGVKHTEAALVQAPADRASVLEWYKMMAPRQAWTLSDQELIDKGTRLLYTRHHEALQIIIGAGRDIFTQVQLIYLDGITERQRQLLIENPGSVTRDSAG